MTQICLNVIMLHRVPNEHILSSEANFNKYPVLRDPLHRDYVEWNAAYIRGCLFVGKHSPSLLSPHCSHTSIQSHNHDMPEDTKQLFITTQN